MSIKSITAAIAATAIAGTVGLAYAQTATTNNNPDSGRALPVQADTSNPVIQTAPSTDSSAPMTDVAPKADRN